jgi:F-type H+-transporting ATPase subunit a
MNKLFGGVALAVMEVVGVHAHDPAHPIPHWMAMQFLVAGVLILFFVFVRSRLSVENPDGWQHVVETLREFIEGQSKEIIGHHGHHFTGFLVALFLFIFSANMLGLIPGFESPTANPAVPLGCAVAAFGYYNLQGVKFQGLLRYLKHFGGPIWWLSPLMLPIEIISNAARLLSLTVRLWANIFAGDLVTLVFFSMIPIGIPIIFLGLHIVVAVLQAYVFTLLTIIYLSGAVAEEH